MAKNSNNDNSVGANIKRIRTRKGLSLRDLANLIDSTGEGRSTTASTISNFEKSEEDPRTVQILRSIASALGVSIHTLIK